MAKSIKSNAVLTGERLMEIETTMKFQSKQIEENKTENKAEHNEIKTLLKDFIESADKKYATKEEVQAIKTDFKDNKGSSRDWVRQAITIGVTLVVAIIGWIIAIGIKG